MESIETARKNLSALRTALRRRFVGRDEVVDLVLLAAAAEEPLLLVGPPGTAKSDLIVSMCDALGMEDGEYFEYLLTPFTEPSEIVGPVDIAQLKEGRYLRRTAGRLPEAKIAFLDEVFKSNSAILNTLLGIVQERKFYQDGKPVPVNLRILYGASNDVPEAEELAALRDRFPLKVETPLVWPSSFDSLVMVGVRNEADRRLGVKGWSAGGLSTYRDLAVFRSHLDQSLAQAFSDSTSSARPDKAMFPENLYVLFRRVLRTLKDEAEVILSDRRVVRLYRLIRARALLWGEGAVTPGDLSILRYVADRKDRFAVSHQVVDSILSLRG